MYAYVNYHQYLFKVLYFNIRNNMFSNDMKINYASYLYFMLKKSFIVTLNTYDQRYGGDFNARTRKSLSIRAY